MRVTQRQRRTIGYLLTAALILGQVAGFLALPQRAEAALSADPNAEIVYIGDDEVIRVLDTQGTPLVQWFSPDAGWDQIVLLDVSNDGDMEILAADFQGESNVRVTVFDPVLALGSTDPNKQINGIPWDVLWTTTFQGQGDYIVSGNFDANISGDEFAVGFRHGDVALVRIYNANSLGGDGRPTGRDWKVHIQKEYPSIQYVYGVSGQLNGEGADELILFDPESDITRMDIYRPDQDMFLTDNETSSNDRFKFGATGHLEEEGNDWLVSILTVNDADRSSLRTYFMANDGELEEDALWAFNPQPDWVFLADIRGNGDKEIFFLRNVPDRLDLPRLIIRDDWGDDQRQNTDLIEWSLLDGGANNEFRAGAGGDVDGDGREEVILMRDDRIRIYHRPETGNDDDSDYNDYMVDTDNNRFNLLAGDLDRNGFTTGPILMVNTVLVEAFVPAGSSSRDFTVTITNVGTAGGVGINASVPPGNSWVQLNPTFATTPASFRIRFNATSLQPGTYSTTLTLSSSAPNVVNNNITVGLNLIVVPPELEVNPPILSMLRLPCESDPCSAEEIAERNEPFTTTVQIDGSDDLAFHAAILGVPPQPSDIVAAAAVDGLTGPITGGAIDADGNIVIYDDFGNSRTLASEQVSAAAVHSTTLMLDPALTWITTATVDSGVVPAEISLGVDPSILTEEFQREYAVMILVADTRAGTPNGNVVLVPIQLANIGDLLWVSFVANE